MPIHNWKKAPSGLFHHFHQQWIGDLCRALNKKVLPAGYSALIEKKTIDVEPDLMTLKGIGASPTKRLSDKGVMLLDARPKVFYSTQVSEEVAYAQKANRVSIRGRDGELVAIVEFVSPGNKHDKTAIDDFVGKVVRFLYNGVNVLIVDLFPPTKRDPQGIHKKIWDELEEKRFKLPANKPLTIASYVGVPDLKAFVQPTAVGETLPDMPLFLVSSKYVPTPLEETYNDSWDAFPDELKPQIPST